MEKQIEDLDWPLLEEEISINSSREPHHLLFDVLNENVNNMDDELFFKYLFSTNDFINKAVEDFKKLLNNRSCPFICLHGYPQNGKTTFIHYVNYLYNKVERNNPFNMIMLPYNFEGASNNGFKDKVINFFLEELFNIPSKNSEITNIIEFNDFVQFYNFFSNELVSKMQQSYSYETPTGNIVSSYFSSFNKDLIAELFDKIETLISNTLSTGGNTNKNISIFKQWVNEFLNRVITEESSGKLFSLMIFFKIFKQREKIFRIPDKKGQLVFVFDNLDDDFTNNDIHFLQKPQIEITILVMNLVNNPKVSPVFSKCIKKYCSEDIQSNNISFSFSEQLKIVYIFRTANFLIYSNIIKNSQHSESRTAERRFPNCMFTNGFISFFTVSLTGDILLKRLNFLNQISSKQNLKLPKGYLFLIGLTKNYPIHSEHTFADKKSIFSLWNGDKKALFNNITQNWDFLNDNYFIYETEVENCYNGEFNHNDYLLKGTYLYFFLELLFRNSDLKNLINSIFAYRNYRKEGKNLRRFIINYIINNCEKKEKALCINDLNEKGVGLHDLLKDIDLLIKKITSDNAPNLNFNFDTINYFLDEISKDKADKFSHLFSIFKSQIVNVKDGDSLSTYYNLINEKEKYTQNPLDSSLNDIRIFNNDNAAFLSSYLITHYELFSFCLSHEKNETNNIRLPIKKPLLFCLVKNQDKRSNKLYKYEFMQIMKEVFYDVKISVNAMVDFYVNRLYKHFNPEDFVKSDFFSVLEKPKETRNKQNNHDDSNININEFQTNGDFQFKLIISRHITYLEGIRQGILNNQIGKIDPDDLLDVNRFIASTILDYANLYVDNYNKINKRSRNKLSKSKSKLNDALNSNMIIIETSTKIIASDQVKNIPIGVHSPH